MAHREKTVFVGDFEGVSWEIQKYPAFSHMNRKWCWTFYLNLAIDRIPKENDPESYWLSPRREGRRIHYDYCGHGVLSSIEWHGGITWYSKECGFDGEVKIIKVGCDYQHAFDEEHGEYDFQEVL